jgi:hypothetical protein
MSRKSLLASLFEKRGLPYPIEWAKLTNVRLVYRAIVSSTSNTKIGLYVATAGLLLSTIGFGVGSYFALTTQVRDTGGVFREGVVGGQMELFNPVLDRSDQLTRRENNLPERKINTLLYAPLYEISPENILKTSLDTATIRPILLAKKPEWTLAAAPENAYKTLTITLGTDAKWSDQSAISCDDVAYTVDRLKEPRGNPRFRSVLQDVTVRIESPTICAFEFTTPSPQALYQLDFSPISRTYFENQNDDGLAISLKSARPQVTSGQWVFPEKTQDVDSTKSKIVQNPLQKNGDNAVVILTPARINNYAAVGRAMPSIAQYALYKYSALSVNKLDSKTRTLAQAAKDKDVDLFTRTYDQGLTVTPSDVKNELSSLSQSIIPQNTFLQLYFNIRKGEDGYLINQSLRRYIACKLVDFSSPSAQKFLLPVPNNQKIIPLELETKGDLDCPTEPETALDKVYTVTNQGNEKTISIGTGEPFTLKMIASREYLPILEELKTYFKEQIGITLAITADETEIQASLTSHDYHFALLSNTIYSHDVASAFSAKKRNLISLPANDRIAQYNINQNLDAYTHSNGADTAAKEQLITFFKTEAVVMTLYQNQQEINYSNRIFDFASSLPTSITTQSQLYQDLSHWYIQTKRVLKKW